MAQIQFKMSYRYFNVLQQRCLLYKAKICLNGYFFLELQLLNILGIETHEVERFKSVAFLYLYYLAIIIINFLIP